MGRVTRETACQDIQALLERGDLATAEKLLKKFSRDLTEEQIRKLKSVQRSAGRRRSFSRQLEALRRSMTRDWLWKLGCHGGWLALFYLMFLLNALAH